jgi:hypothetical protein
MCPSGVEDAPGNGNGPGEGEASEFLHVKYVGRWPNVTALKWSLL